MNIKITLFIIFACHISSAQLSDLTLIILGQLNIDETDCEGLITEMELPDNRDETVIVIPKMGNNEDGFISFDSYVALVNNKTNEIKSLFFENYETSGWESDAVFIYEISIDTTSYLIDKKTKAYGIILEKRNMSQPNPYWNKSISIFISEGKELKNILKNYPIYEYGGETDTNCYGEFIIENRELKISENSTNGFFDIVVDITNKTVIYEEINGECEDKVTNMQSKKITLTYENGNYKQQ